MSDPVWLVLDPLNCIDGSQWESFLGTVVKNPCNPLGDRAPEHPANFRLSPLSETTFDQFTYNTGHRQAESKDFLVQGLGRLRLSRGAGDTLSLVGKTIYIKKLQQCGMFWGNLKLDQKWDATVAGWIEEKRFGIYRKNIVCWVVGLLICEDARLSSTASTHKQKEVRQGLPLGTLAAMGALTQGVVVPTDGIGNVDAGWKNASAGDTTVAGQARGLRVFAIEVRWVKSKHRFPDDGPSIRRQLAGDGFDLEDTEITDLPDTFWDAIRDESLEGGLPDGLANRIYTEAERQTGNITDNWNEDHAEGPQVEDVD